MTGVSSLFLSWQAPESRRIYPVARVMRLPSGEFELSYIRAARDAEKHGFAGLPGFENLDEVYLSSELPQLFHARPVPRGRRVPLQGERELQQPANDTLDAAPITLFVSRKAGVPPERLEAFAPPLPGGSEIYFGVFVIRGVGRIPGSGELVERLAASEALELEPEPSNAYNPNALRVTRADGSPLGYLPDYLANELSHVPDAPARFGLTLVAAHRLNFSPAEPLYQVTCRYQCDGRIGRSLFRSSAYEPICPRSQRAPR